MFAAGSDQIADSVAASLASRSRQCDARGPARGAFKLRLEGVGELLPGSPCCGSFARLPRSGDALPAMGQPEERTPVVKATSVSYKSARQSITPMTRAQRLIGGRWSASPEKVAAVLVRVAAYKIHVALHVRGVALRLGLLWILDELIEPVQCRTQLFVGLGPHLVDTVLSGLRWRWPLGWRRRRR